MRSVSSAESGRRIGTRRMMNCVASLGKGKTSVKSQAQCFGFRGDHPSMRHCVDQPDSTRAVNGTSTQCVQPYATRKENKETKRTGQCLMFQAGSRLRALHSACSIFSSSRSQTRPQANRATIGLGVILLCNHRSDNLF